MSKTNKKKALFASPYDEPLRLDNEVSFEPSDLFLIDKLSDEEFFDGDEPQPFYFDPSRAEFEGLYASDATNSMFDKQMEPEHQDVEDNDENELNYSLFDNQVDRVYEQIAFPNSVSSKLMSQRSHQTEWKVRMNEVSSKYVSDVDQEETRLDGANFQQLLKPVSLLPLQYRSIFAEFPYFNYVQSTVYDDLIHSDENVVISAPTSSGKTVILELAIVRLLITSCYNPRLKANFKVIYMAPLKALCSEKFKEWSGKFERSLKLKCIELTGDTDQDEENVFQLVQTANIICTTPEKWDIVTRKWKNSRAIIDSIKLFLIDEIHVLGESSRGAVIEAVISRMKTFASKRQRGQSTSQDQSTIRFVAISATIPNIEDFANWLGDASSAKAALYYKMNEKFRPVKLEKFVLGYYCSPKMSDYCFDLSLSYKLAQVVDTYSDSKPTLIFCSTRKSTQEAAKILAKANVYIKSREHKNALIDASSRLNDSTLKQLVQMHGIGYHHAGMDSSDRHLIESLFLSGNLLVLLSTSTLSIGVNLPAHLVIIKSTMCYSANQSYVEYSTSQILQMIGRAGRPQFDKSAKAVIMTKTSEKKKYEGLLEGMQQIESHLHHELIEHLNVEIVLKTIADLSSAIDWLKSTFLYTRLVKNPSYYGITIEKAKLFDEHIEEYLRNLCIRNLSALMECDLIETCDFISDPNAQLVANANGHLLAKYSLAFKTMESIIREVQFRQVENAHLYADETKTMQQPSKSLPDLITLIASSKEFEDIKLRTNEKSILNALNNNGKVSKAKNNASNTQMDSNWIKYRLNGKIKTNQMKTNVLIQAQLGSIEPNDFSLRQDTFRIMRVGQRISKCLLEYLIQNKHHVNTPNGFQMVPRNYQTFLNAVLLNKCFNCKLWHDSPHITKQFNRIGSVLSQLFVNQNITTFDKLLTFKSHQLELLLNKNRPFGEMILNTVAKLPKFRIEFVPKSNLVSSEQDSFGVEIRCVMENCDSLRDSNDGGCLGLSNPILFVLGDEKNNLICFNNLKNSTFLANEEGVWTRTFSFNIDQNGYSIHASLILQKFVGLDVHAAYELATKPIEVEKSTEKSQKKTAPRLKRLLSSNEIHSHKDKISAYLADNQIVPEPEKAMSSVTLSLNKKKVKWKDDLNTDQNETSKTNGSSKAFDVSLSNYLDKFAYNNNRSINIGKLSSQSESKVFNSTPNVKYGSNETQPGPRKFNFKLPSDKQKVSLDPSQNPNKIDYYFNAKKKEQSSITKSEDQIAPNKSRVEQAPKNKNLFYSDQPEAKKESFNGSFKLNLPLIEPNSILNSDFKPIDAILPVEKNLISNSKLPYTQKGFFLNQLYKFD